MLVNNNLYTNYKVVAQLVFVSAQSVDFQSDNRVGRKRREREGMAGCVQIVRFVAVAGVQDYLCANKKHRA